MSYRQRSWIGFAIAGIVLLLTSLLTYRSVVQLERNQRWVTHTLRVQQRLNATLSAVRHAETAQRGYLITENPSFAEDFEPSAGYADRFSAELVTLVDDNPAQHALAKQLRERVLMRIRLIRDSLVAANAGNFEEARRLVGIGAGEQLMREIDQLTRQLASGERRLLDARIADSDRSRKIVTSAFAIAVALNLALLFIVGGAVARNVQLQRRAAAELEARVEQRTAELREANSELQAFAHSIAHDLRAPLRNMHGFSRALLEDYGDRLDEDGRLYAERIAHGAERLDELIQDLLSYSRLTRADIELASVDLNRLVRRVVQEMQPELAAAGAEIALDADMPSVRAHAATLGQVLTNLLSNAAKFVAKGVRPSIEIRARSNGDTVRVSVKDNGIGIEPRFHERIFRVFERLDGSMTYAGTGIGLAIVRKGIDRMGGKVGLTSTPGAGTEFWFELESARPAPKYDIGMEGTGNLNEHTDRA